MSTTVRGNIEQQGGLTKHQHRSLCRNRGNVSLAPVATVDEETYRALHNEHRLIADVVCFWMPYQPSDATYAGY
ncbi:2-oxoadipate dioxygenase/decarboxylase family protein [Shigella flexneri]